MQRDLSARAQLLILVGPKGAGKTTLGRILEQRLGVHFLHVEPIAQRVLAACGGVVDEHYARRSFQAILDAVDAAARACGALVIESTGASTESGSFFAALRERCDVRLIRVHAARATCDARIAARDPTHQVQVPPELVAKMYERSVALSLPWDLEFDNDASLSPDALVAAVRPLLRTDEPPREAET